MQPWFSPPAHGPVLAAVLIAAGTGVHAQVPDEPPEWADEPPVLSRWLEEGYDAEVRRQPHRAASRYCDAARYGSVEAQYRLGRLLLHGRDVMPDPAAAATLLAMAAQRGHEKARSLAQGMVPGDHLPDCLTTGEAPRLEVRDSAQEVVPQEVVDRYVSNLPDDKRRHAELVRRLAPRFDVDPRLALAIVRSESNFQARALSPRNAQGLMQLIPETAERFGVRDAWSPEQNVRGGLAYLRWLLDRFAGDVALTSAAYNAGEKAVERHGGVPPYAETREYVRRILGFYRSAQHERPVAGPASLASARAKKPPGP
ncbi:MULTISPECIES: lytic transglycosylase domain-containing protein [unclassified Acidovorax]|uniref:lytic transglycosylase domain-containing protein n=1 Tax=unclassified Acidovorax TaxID=2684926 RepID=UPI001C441047|nr:MULTISPECIES: lytic transglycosylase domain-containing protein [unclassified Acidovorax]MBV7427642.1 lytic transglycosylase domain-containing protein [Acidovorax sp. sif0732]MBV7450002.1 lytic transglycosylase domain-containing protein [Acidovorax sp. sif0715]